LLRFLYCERANVTKDNLIDLYLAADRYQVEELKPICLQGITADNAIYIYKVNLEQHKYPDIDEACSDIITKHPFVALNSEEFCKLSLSHVTTILKKQHFRCSFSDLSNALKLWLQSNNALDLNTKDVYEQMQKEIFKMPIQRIILYGSMRPGTTMSYVLYLSFLKSVTLIGLGLMNKAVVSEVQIKMFDGINNLANLTYTMAKKIGDDPQCLEEDKEIYFDGIRINGIGRLEITVETEAIPDEVLCYSFTSKYIVYQKGYCSVISHLIVEDLEK
jgi:hypothetical protein